jgi:O-antigen ligase
MMRVSAARPVSESPRHAFSPVVLVLAVVVLSVTAAYLLAGGSKKDIALALAVAAGPVLLYLAIKRPFVFPFGLYAVLVPFNHLSYVQGLGTMTKLAGILASAALIFYVVRTKRWVRPPRVLFAWLAFVTWICASVLWAVNPDGSLYVIGILLQLFALFAVTAIVQVSPRELRAVLVLVALGGIAAAIYGGKLFLAGAQTESRRLFLEGAVQHESVDPNHFSASLLLPIALVLVYALYTHGVFRKLAAYCGLAALLLGIYASGSRGALVATAAIMVVVFWRTRRWLELAFVTVTGIVLSLAVNASTWARFSVDPSGSGRTSIWLIGAHAFAQRPLFGWGIGNFADAYDQWVLRLYSPIFTKWGRAPHDFVLMTGVELGIVGLALLMWVIVEQARALRHIGPQDELYAIRVALESALIGILVVSFFLDTLYWKYTWLVFTAVVLARSASLQATERLPVRTATMTRAVTSP